MVDKKKTGKPLKGEEYKVVELSDDEIDSVVGGSVLDKIKKSNTIDLDDIEDLVK